MLRASLLARLRRLCERSAAPPSRRPRNCSARHHAGARLGPTAIGSYAKGCLAGGAALPVDGPAWQAMRLSRNRIWGHPELIAFIERLAHRGHAPTAGRACWSATWRSRAAARCAPATPRTRSGSTSISG